jgi:pilus assembly protein CpaC
VIRRVLRPVDLLLLCGLALCASVMRAGQTSPVNESEHITVGAGMTHLLDMAVNIERVSVASPETVEAVPVSARSLMVNGRAPGETSLVVWLSDGSRKEYDVDVKVAVARIEAAKDQLEREFGNSVQLTVDNLSVYLSGTVRDMFQAQRAVSIATAVGRVVNLLKISVPPQERQILLKVRFADVDRSKSLELGINLFGIIKGYPFTESAGTAGGASLSSLTPPITFTLSDALNLFLFDPHANIGAGIQALAGKNVLQILAEPNLLAMNGKEATFVAGGEFPYPTLQGGGAGVGQVTISFREFGIRLRFVPTITPRGTIKLHVAPEVSSLDFANALSVAGGTVPALNTRKVETDVELQDGQSFGIAGLLNNQTTETLSKIPGLGDIPVLGKLFQSKTVNRQNSELLVIVTPEFVDPIPGGQNLPELPMPLSFLQGPGVMTQPPQTPGVDKTGSATARPPRTEISVQEMEQMQRLDQGPVQGSAPANALPAVNVPGVNAPPAPAGSPAAGSAAPASASVPGTP